MKNIDPKSLIIGALLTSTIFLGVAAAPSGTGTAKDASVWDLDQFWDVDDLSTGKAGWEPFTVNKSGTVLWRKRLK
jgi:hypothetical protein